jgi:hypothetical protein
MTSSRNSLKAFSTVAPVRVFGRRVSVAFLSTFFISYTGWSTSTCSLNSFRFALNKRFVAPAFLLDLSYSQARPAKQSP